MGTANSVMRRSACVPLVAVLCTVKGFPMSQDASRKSVHLSELQAADFYRMQVRELRGYAMFIIDTQGILTSWNEGVQKLLGYSEQEWIGQHASMIFTPADKAME